MKTLSLAACAMSLVAFAAQAQPRVVIVKSEFALYLYDGETLVKTYRVAVGKNPGDKEAEGDMRTPVGKFRIENIHDSRAWTHDFKDGKGEIKGAYGPWFLRLYVGKWKGIGIHGTHDPESIGTRATEGCVRMKNEDLIDLKARVKIGTPVEIRE